MKDIQYKLKKGMTILALVGTVAVTVVLAYMPIRKALRERNQTEISLNEEGQESDTIDLAEAGAGQPFDEQALWQQTEAGSSQSTSKQWDVSLTVKTDDATIKVNLWNDEDASYFFMPSYVLTQENETGSAVEVVLESCLNGGKLLIDGKQIKEGDRISDIAWEQWYSMILYDKTGEAAAEMDVVFLAAENLPVVAINTESGSMDHIEAEKGNAESGQITIHDEKGTLLYEGDVSEIKGRGNSTWSLPKKPYQFKLAKSSDLFGFGQARSYNLLANGYDETGIRNLLAADLANALALDYTPEGVIVSLYCNGEYKGNYYLCEKVQVGENRVGIRDQEEEFRKLYQGISLDKIESITSEDTLRKWADIDYRPTDISGGYLIERELYERYEADTVSGFCTMQLDYYAIQSPEYASYEQVKYIADLMQAVQDAIEAPDGIHPESGRHYTDYIDLDSFVGKYLVDEVSKNYDGGVTSAFFYKPEDSVSNKLFAGPIWDYDVAFGNAPLDEINSNPQGITKMEDHYWSPKLYADLYEKEDFKARVIAGYHKVVQPWLEEMVETGIEEYAQYYRSSTLVNNIRWRNMYNRYEYYLSYDNNIRYLKYFVAERMNFLNEVWLDNVTYHCITLVVDGEPWKKIYVKDGETAGYMPTPRRSDSVFVGWYKEGNPLFYDEYKPVYEDMTFEAWWQEINHEESDEQVEIIE